MAISIPDTLTTDNSEKYILSIRLCPGGLSFSGYIPSDGGRFFYREVEFDRSNSYVSSLKDFFFENDFLSWVYKRIHVIYVSSQYTLVPKAFFQEKDRREYLSFNFSAPEETCLNNTLKTENAEVVFGLDKEVYEFCSRSLLNPDFTHHITSFLSLWEKRSRMNPSRQMCVFLHDKMMDIACYSQGSLLFVNSFETDMEDEILYYILSAWRGTDMDQVADMLYIAGNPVLRNRIMEALKTYLQHVSVMEIPSEAYLLGGDIGQVPMDLISLLICEL